MTDDKGTEEVTGEKEGKKETGTGKHGIKNKNNKVKIAEHF